MLFASVFLEEDILYFMKNDILLLHIFT